MAGTSDIDEFIKQGLLEADELTKKEFEGSLDMQKVIAAGKEEVSSITVNGVEIKFKSFLPRPLRRALTKISKAPEDADIDEEGVLYNTLASICINKPFNTPSAWNYIEENGGDAVDILNKIMEVINGNTEKMKKFRGKS
jgi:hypothetical protein